MARVLMRELLRYTRNPNSSINPISLSKINHYHSSESTTPSDLSYLSFEIKERRIINTIQTCQHSTKFYQIQSHFITSGFLQNPSIADRVLKLSLNYCDIDYTLFIFKLIHFPDTFCVNTVIKAYACSCLPNKVVRFYFEMLEEDGVLFKPNSYTFSSLISSCTKSKDSRLGKECHGQAVKVGVDRCLYVENPLIHFYASCGFSDDAWKVFGEMSVRDLVSWNSMVDGYVKFGEMGNAHKLFDEMPERNVGSWNVVIKGYLDGKNPGLVLKLFRKMVKVGGRGNDTTIVSVVTACGRSRRLKEGKSVHAFIIRTLTDVSLFIGTALIDMYCRCERSDVARSIFDRMLIKNLVCWNAMITGQSIHGNPRHGLQLFDKMLNLDKVIPDEITYVGVLCACARIGLMPEGKNHFLEMTKVYGIKPSFAHYFCMANLYASHGLVDEAVDFLKSMPVDISISPQSPLWAGLLGSCRFRGDVAIGEQIATALIEADPLNHSHYVLLILIYAVAGRWDDVNRMKCIMKERGIRVPGFSLLDLTDIVNSLEVGDKLEDRIASLNG
ncbi:pentatricopeptide repeat-containing protein At3g51320 [Rutidosis leptorrhynchoides]|uniref:pentatricopeptide repeat-containing protein At3g51320 n=1 Tax=Rutidosis leptorrhynchoides TaxID=125765 RepID=UPI003A997569